MIVGLVLVLFASVIGGAVGLVPDFEGPNWLSYDGFCADGASTLPCHAEWLGNKVGPFASWIPVTAIADTATWFVAMIVVASAIRLARMAISHLTGGGGAVS